MVIPGAAIKLKTKISYQHKLKYFTQIMHHQPSDFTLLYFPAKYLQSLKSQQCQIRSNYNFCKKSNRTRKAKSVEKIKFTLPKDFTGFSIYSFTATNFKCVIFFFQNNNTFNLLLYIQKYYPDQVINLSTLRLADNSTHQSFSQDRKPTPLF